MLVDKVNDFSLEFASGGSLSSRPFSFQTRFLSSIILCRRQMLRCRRANHVSLEGEGSAVPVRPRKRLRKIFVPTVDTSRLTYLLDSLFESKRYVMFVGNTGTGKTAIMRSKLSSMDAGDQCTVSMNSFTEAWDLQPTLEAPLEKKWNALWTAGSKAHLLHRRHEHAKQGQV